MPLRTGKTWGRLLHFSNFEYVLKISKNQSFQNHSVSRGFVQLLSTTTYPTQEFCTSIPRPVLFPRSSTFCFLHTNTSHMRQVVQTSSKQILPRKSFQAPNSILYQSQLKPTGRVFSQVLSYKFPYPFTFNSTSRKPLRLIIKQATTSISSQRFQNASLKTLTILKNVHIRRMGQVGGTVVSAPVTSGGVLLHQGAPLKLSYLATIRARLGITPKTLLILGHSASLFGVVALFMKDMLWLRTFMVCGSCCGVLFNLLQPCPLKIPAMWGCVFVSLNLFQIGVLLHERRPITFKSEEAEVYASVFQKHGVTPHQFEKLMSKADVEWLDLPAGHIVLKEGECVETVSVIVRGRANVFKDDEVVGEVSPGSLVGETALLVEGHRAGHTVQTSEPSRVVQWPRDKLSKMLAGDQNLLLCTAQVINTDLAAKLKNSANVTNKAKVLEMYQEVMKAMLGDGVIHPSQKRALREYRTSHHITSAQHLEAVQLCGWTPVEFEDGMKMDPQRHHFSLRKSLEGLHLKSDSHPSDKNVGSSETKGVLIPDVVQAANEPNRAIET